MRSGFIGRFAVLALLLAVPLFAQQTITIDAHAPATSFPHFWEQMFGSGRAILTLRESYRDDLRAVHAITGFRYVRFHAILHDELGVYTEDEHGNPVYNFAYVDQVYDGLLKTASGPSSRSASCRRSSPSTPTPCTPSGTSRTFPRLGRSPAGTRS